jgi:hypothetical protein
MNTLDFTKISKALQSSYKALNNGFEESVSVSEQLDQAQSEYMKALSYATSIDEEFLRYTK